ncbi:MAG TPA: catalase family protein [Beijerinckiaceae bacterium]|jgi:hypothetical protein
MPSDSTSGAIQIEAVDPEEAKRIDHVVDLTEQQLRSRYAKAPRFLRGVHPKDHGCVDATFTVRNDILPDYRVGVFTEPGRQFRARIRFSNAAPLVMPDSTLVKGPPETVTHGSRGMALKLYDVDGPRLVPTDNERTQDFLMINQPVFAFANVEDYEALSEVILKDKEDPTRFFARLKHPDPKVRARAAETLRIVNCIKSNSTVDEKAPAFQAPPLSPLDNRYFSAAPFMFGEGWVVKFGATPVAPISGELGDAVKDENYLRTALNKRLAAAGGENVVFEFQIQPRRLESLTSIENDIENACALWDEDTYPFRTLATIAIPPQDTSANREACESLVFTPWHGLAAHRPLGGINRMRRAVYEKSAELRRPTGAAAV